MKRAIYQPLIIILLILFITCQIQCHEAKEENMIKKGTNRLIKEKSPYLLQHAHNPVDWYPWGEEAFKKAKKENKPIFLSIGYSTCHWCHVMEKESFEDEEVANFLNQHFISIKVDREEHPDIDQIYMDAVQAMTGRGGWPMTIIMTPDLKPFFGGTYFPKSQLMSILDQIQSLWNNQRDKILESSEKIISHMKSRNILMEGDIKLDESFFQKVYQLSARSFDKVYGGFGGAPKFPPTMKLNLLMRIYHRSRNKKVLEIVEVTLDKMARGGIYDHLGGGFHRYSTDKRWLVPHFEKMLYDNANLAWSYLEAFQITKKKKYSLIVREILNYILRDMTGEKGRFYSAEDADSEGEEGKFYIWKEKELKQLLTKKEFDLFRKMYGTTTRGNFEGENILNLQKKYKWESKYNKISKRINEKLFNIRQKRIHPFKDDKTITAWNGLMIASMAKAYQVLGDEKYLKAARDAAMFIKDKMYKNKKLLRRFRDGESRFEGNLDDYAYLIQGLIILYESDFNEKWIKWVLELQEVQNKLFWDKEGGGYFFSPKGKDNIVLRKKVFTDSARANPNSVSALNLLKLYHFTFNKAYKKKAEKLLKISGSYMKNYPHYVTQMLIALDFYLDKTKEIAIVSPQDKFKRSELIEFLQKIYLPNKILAWTGSAHNSSLVILKNKTLFDKRTTVYICEEGTCKYPTGDIDKIKKMLEDRKYYKINN